jgi:hypothetical protein
MKININDIQAAIQGHYIAPSISLGSADQIKQFEEMLSFDSTTYVNIAMAEAQLRKIKMDYYTLEAAIIPGMDKKLQDLTRRITNTRLSYEKRQAEYRNSSAFKAQQAIRAASDKVTSWVSNLYKKYRGNVSGLGDAGFLTVPIVIGISAVLSVAIVSYFINNYYKATLVDYNDAMATIAEISKTDPQLAKEMMSDLKGVVKSQSLFGMLGKILGVSALAYGSIKLYESQTKKILISF